MGCDTVRQQGATTLRAHAREEEQRRWRAVAQLNRVCSALTQMVNVVVCTKFSVHAVWSAVSSGQLRNLGSVQGRMSAQGRAPGAQRDVILEAVQLADYWTAIRSVSATPEIPAPSSSENAGH